MLTGENTSGAGVVEEAIPLIIFNEEKRSKYQLSFTIYRLGSNCVMYLFSVWNQRRRQIIPIRLERATRYCGRGGHVQNGQELSVEPHASGQKRWLWRWTNHQSLHQGCVDVVEANWGIDSGWWSDSSDHHGYRRSWRPGRGLESWCQNFLLGHPPLVVLHLQFCGFHRRERPPEPESSRQLDQAYLD